MCTSDLHNAHPSHESFTYIFKFPLENHSKMCWKSAPKIWPTFLATQTSFGRHLASQKSFQNHLKVTKNGVGGPKKSPWPSQSLQEGCRTLRKPPKRLQKPPLTPPKASKMDPRSLKTVKVTRQFKIVYSLQWTRISHTRKCASKASTTGNQGVVRSKQPSSQFHLYSSTLTIVATLRTPSRR